MTCIVAIETGNGVIMGCDSCYTVGVAERLCASPKVVKKTAYDTEWLIGGAGHDRDIRLVQHAVKLPKAPTRPDALDGFMTTSAVNAFRKALSGGGKLCKMNEEESSDGVFLIGVRGRIYKVSYNFATPRNSLGYEAIGTGEDVAVGVMWATKDLPPEQRVEMALTAAEEHCAGVRGPFHIIESKT